MSAALDTLTRMTDALAISRQGDMPQMDMIRLWRGCSADLPAPE